MEPQQLSEETLDLVDGFDELWCCVPLELGWQPNRLVLSSEQPFSLTRRGRQLWVGLVNGEHYPSVGFDKAQLMTHNGELALAVENQFGPTRSHTVIHAATASALVQDAIARCQSAQTQLLYALEEHRPDLRPAINHYVLQRVGAEPGALQHLLDQMPANLLQRWNESVALEQRLKQDGEVGAEQMLREFADQVVQNAPERTQWFIKGPNAGQALTVCCPNVLPLKLKVRNRTFQSRQFTLGDRKEQCAPYGHFSTLGSQPGGRALLSVV